MDFGLTVAMLVLAISVLGWIGEISLAVVAQMGLGLRRPQLVAGPHRSLPLAAQLLLVALSSIPISLLLGLFALRLRGVNFVIASLAFAGHGAEGLLPEGPRGRPRRSKGGSAGPSSSAPTWRSTT